jgi:hypothetical protein
VASISKVKGVKTRNGKPIWVDELNYGEEYSEKTESYDYGDGYLVTPTINPETGDRYDIDMLMDHYKENGPYDLYTGEKLPVFDSIKDADEYSKWRSDNLLNFDLSDQEFYTGESGYYSKQDGSEETWDDRKQDAIDTLANARDGVYGFLGIPLDDDEEPEMALGGLAVSRKGIKTQEGLDMANNRFQLDQKKADLDKDGKLSDYEEARGEAVQKANVDDPENDEKMQMYHGGMPCDCGGDCDGSCGGMMSDPVSGNPIPVGSSAENVRDDIEAMISEGEYVLPANVVKWHGLKHIMDMQAEAEMGLMGMFDMGLIQYAGEEEAEEPEEVTEAEDDIPEEDVDIEVAAVEVDDMMDDDEEVEEVYPTTSKLPGMIKKQKMVIMS